MSNPLEDLAERLLDVTQSGQDRLTELRATADNSLQLQEQLLVQADRILQAGTGACASTGREPTELERENAELQDELKWTRGQLLEAREELEQGGGAGGDDAKQLQTQLEQAYRELEMLRNELSEAHDELDELSDPIMARGGNAAESPEQAETIAKLQEQVESLQSQLEAAQADEANDAVPTPEHDRFATSEEIAAERENLRQLQEEWHQKLRKSELEISLERAKMARERAEMEERITMMEGELRALKDAGTTPKESTKGKWFARLGLKDS